MFTEAAARSLTIRTRLGATNVWSMRDLERSGISVSVTRANVAARRWQRIGRAVVRHHGALTRTELAAVALIAVSARTLLTSFTALEHAGLVHWEREVIHVLVPAGARVARPAGLPVRIHYTGDWTDRKRRGREHLDAPARSALVAAASFNGVRPACGVLAAVVQQRLVLADHLVTALEADRCIRHHRQLLAAAHDIGQGAEALSEIDLAQLCRRYGLPEPVRQAVRRDAGGRRRYVDAEWRTRRGGRLVVEIDGALHLAASRWWADQLRQNELVLSGDRVLRFPSVVVRTDPQLVADQIRQGLSL